MEVPFEYRPEDITNIETLWTNKISVTEYDFKSLPPLLKGIHELFFEKTTLQGNILKYLECPRIDNLGFNNCQFKSSIDELLGYQPVGNLIFVYTQFPDSFYKIKDTNRQHTLDSFKCGPSTNLSDDITPFFDQCPELQSVMIFDSSLQCTFIRDMKYVDSLEEIEIANTNLNDEVFSSILRFRNLQSVGIINCKVTKKSIPVLEELAKKVPNVHVMYQDETIFYTVDGKAQL